ncbi:hypothetical protein PMAYCL1PPCAC_10542, partial [Pristionchus mayeri]
QIQFSPPFDDLFEHYEDEEEGAADVESEQRRRRGITKEDLLCKADPAVQLILDSPAHSVSNHDDQDHLQSSGSNGGRRHAPSERTCVVSQDDPPYVECEDHLR